MLLPTAATAINTYTTIDHCMYIFWPAKFLKYDSLENFHLPYSGFYWRTANLAISSFLQIGEDLTWRSLPTSHHTHINIDHTHHEIVIHCIIDNCMHACSYLVVDQLFWSIRLYLPLFFGSLLSAISSTASFAFLSCNSVKDDPSSMPNVGSDALPSSFLFRYLNSAILLSQSRETALTYT